MGGYATSIFYGIEPEFFDAMQKTINTLTQKEGIFIGDQLFTFQRNLSFLSDTPFMTAFEKNAITPIEKSLLWRNAVLVWAARHALNLEGDFVECACYKGTTAKIICDTLDFASLSKNYYLYDLFEHDHTMQHHALPEHGETLFEQTKARFEPYPNVIITQGKVPEVLKQVAPEKISFMHIDMNNAAAEIGTLEALFDRMVPGAVLVLDDYGWMAYRAQKEAEDPWLQARGHFVLELPTGQGIVFKH